MDGEVIYLSDETLRDVSWVEGVVQTETSDVGMGGDSLPALYIFDFWDFWCFNIHFLIY